MKICKLKLKNLNSFREPVELDFENPPLDDASLVAITGPTGAGKTTLLDAICVALYGKTPRLTGQGSQNPKHLISHGEKEGFAEVHFMVNGTRYLATWAAKQNGSPKGELFLPDDDKLITDRLSTRGKSLGSSQKTVSEEVEAILGLDFDAFRRSVMLAQGEFAAFLKAKNEERRTILEATAGISIYEILKDTLNRKVSEVEAANADVLGKLNKIPEASHEQLAQKPRQNFDGFTSGNRGVREANPANSAGETIGKRNAKRTLRKIPIFRKASSTNSLNLQPEVNALRVELENAQRAKDLRSEKREYDTTKAEREAAEKALDTATMEKADAEARVETDQTVYDEKETTYQTVANERDQKMLIYAAAKLNVSQAKNQFAEVEKRESRLVNLSDQIDALNDQLSDRQVKQTDLQNRN